MKMKLNNTTNETVIVYPHLSTRAVDGYGYANTLIKLLKESGKSITVGDMLVWSQKMKSEHFADDPRGTGAFIDAIERSVKNARDNHDAMYHLVVSAGELCHRVSEKLGTRFAGFEEAARQIFQ